MREYSLNSTYESIRRGLSKTDERKEGKERDRKVQFNLVATTPSIPNPTNPFIPVLVFLSVSSLVYYFYNSKK
jgi:hypothetical protein